MASSSSSTPYSQSPKKYDVFISFRGEDTRSNFTSHLHDALHSKQIYTYIDYRLEKGDEVWPSLEKAIEDSTLFLVIFSKNYASSTWCLKEPTKILECSKNEGQLVIPVFHRVDPTHVRKESWSYQKAFEEHELKSINEQQLAKWREALTHASNLSGWHCSFVRDDEAELIREIVNCVIQRLGRMYQSEDYLKDLIGIHKRIADLELLLDKSSNIVQVIGIWGMGGIGKTTLAKVLFHKLRYAYEGFCFMAHVREEARKYGIDALREKLILKLLGDTKSHIGMLDSISPVAMNRLGRKKVFIVLDDVDDHEQLENLARGHEFGSGSKILITTRDKQVLGKEVDDIYQLKALNYDEAFILFSINAFGDDYADPENLVNLSKIDLSRSKNLMELPDFSKAIHLEEVELSFCSKLQSVHSSILSLHSLRRLLLYNCRALTSLKSNTHLKSLSYLDLEYCSRLNEFSVTSENSGFQLMLSCTSIHGELCSSSGHLSKIDSLKLVECENVTSLHKLVDLRNLTHLLVYKCNKLASNLCSTFDDMRALQVLSLIDCSELFEVPDNINLLSSLCELNLSRSNIETLPLSIKHLSSLRRLSLYECKRLRSLKLPPSISTLIAQHCRSLETFHSPLTNEDEEGNKADYDKQIICNNHNPCFRFTNCLKLDGHSIKAAEAKVLLEINRAIHEKVEMEYPGERVPEWFMYRTTQSSITVDLCTIPQPWDGNFIFCAVIPKSTQKNKILVKWFIDGQYTCKSFGADCYDLLWSDHVFFWYDRKSCGEVQRKIEEKKRDAQTNSYHPLLQIEFGMEDSFAFDHEIISVEECGVCPTSALEYQTYIKRIQLASQPHPNSIAMETPSRKRKYQLG
ncbi:hypothetical protein K1719_019440 [Acacia pycnantha]|nr:hypothetical protein K1719_019440 [Acacia pycnantha]